MLSPDLLSPDQLNLVDRIYEHDVTFAVCGMGFGKTVCALTAASELMADGVFKRLLVVAPLKPARLVWATEHKKWSHLNYLNVAVAVGTPEQRMRAIESDADIVVINFENLVWFLNTYKTHTFDGLLIDELSKLKDNGSKAVKKLRYRIKDFKHVTGLTGTPVNEGLTGLFSQVLCLDGGVRFGKSKARFLVKYFYATDYEQRNWEIRDSQLKPMLDVIKDILYVAPDYQHELPPLVESLIYFDMPLRALVGYNQFKRDSIYKLAGGDEIIAESAAVLSGKLTQFASGFLYAEDKEEYPIHGSRLNALEDYLNAPLHTGHNHLIFYQFTADKERLIEYFGSRARLLDGDKTEAAWNNGEIEILLAHHLSAGHGLNLQAGGCRVLFYCPIWSNDAQKQCIARLWRRGQQSVVVASTLVCRDTVNELTIARIEDKEEYDRVFKEHCGG